MKFKYKMMICLNYRNFFRENIFSFTKENVFATVYKKLNNWYV